MAKKITYLFLLLCLCTTLSLSAQSVPVVRGTWITNVASEAMRSPEEIRKTVAHCKRNGLTDIFVVVWNRGVTMYPSKVVKRYIGIEQDKVFKGFDPLKTFVAEGHKAGLRVHAWFEFGFSYAYKDSSVNLWLSKYPEWVGRDNKGRLLQKNGFFWWNAIRSDVQTFMKALVLEVVGNYGIDGIQGDDRLPAMPAEGGYDHFTKQLYASTHNGAAPPNETKEATWLQWKADQLSLFGKDLYQAVKKRRKDCLVTWAPSIYPWSKEQYLQDWPKWVKEGYADWVIPQVYRYQLGAYEQTLKAMSDAIPPDMKTKLFPGMLTSLGDGYRASPAMIDSMIHLNRKYGYQGEVFFYYETIKETSKPIYP